MGKKEEILNCALELFNTEGLDNVTTRSISNKLGISPGNLTYHFKKKDEIIYGLYLELVNEISQVMSAQMNSEISIKGVHQGMMLMYGCLLKYKFCMIDFVQLMRTQPKIKEHFNQLMEFRKMQFGMLFQKSIEAGIMLPEEFAGQHQSLGLTMSVHGDYWLSHAEILFNGTNEMSLQVYVNNFMSILFPYLTPKGKKELVELIKQ